MPGSTNNGPVVHAIRGSYATSSRRKIRPFNNGTLALQIALQGMGIGGEVITTPFTFVATMTYALVSWNKARLSWILSRITTRLIRRGSRLRLRPDLPRSSPEMFSAIRRASRLGRRGQ